MFFYHSDPFECVHSDTQSVEENREASEDSQGRSLLEEDEDILHHNHNGGRYVNDVGEYTQRGEMGERGNGVETQLKGETSPHVNRGRIEA